MVTRTKTKRPKEKGTVMPLFAGFISTPGLIIPLVAIVMGCAIPIAAIIFDFIKRKRFMELLHQQRMAAIEKGIDLPPLSMALLEEGRRSRRPSSSLRCGLVWLFTGLGIMVALYARDDEFRKALYGAIPAGVGLAYLIYYFVEGKKVEEELRKTEPQPPGPHVSHT
jgi:hypothetical protein